MAGNKVNAKAKGKDDKGKGNNKSIVPTSEETEDPDFSLLRKPIHTSITGFSQARKIFDMATEELKTLLSDECDLLYECKVCRNLFRSLANFISHKRVYCKEKFNSTVHGHFVKSSSTVNELIKIKRTEDGYQESLRESNVQEPMDTDEVDERIPLTKDLTAIIEKIAKNQGTSELNNGEQQITLQKIPSSAVAVFQNIDIGEENESENMRTQVNEIENILSRNVAVLQSDGNFQIQSSIPTETESVIQISDDEEGGDTDELKCKKCDMQFSTQKTLKFHMKYKHVDTRLVYPCPDCLEIFSTSWSVYRHLFKVHRKTAAQIRRLRESIQAKAFKMNNPPAFYEKRKNNMKTPPVQKISEEERLDQENQAWMDNMEGDGEVPRCGGCGRTFERRAALAAHTHTCQPRSRALARRPQETKRIEIQIRKDYNKGPPTNINLPVKTTDVNENKTSPLKEEEVPKIDVKKEEEVPEEENQNVDENSMDSVSRQSCDEQTSNDATEPPEKGNDTEIVPKPETAKPITRLPFAQHIEKSNLMALRQRIIPDIELEILLCKKCDTQCSHIQELYDHVANHYKWMRYACKLCNFKHYYFEKLPEHVKVVHKLKGDKDFYFSTVKAIDGTEAVELAEPIEEAAEVNDTSPNSRRPSRCSSDSSRLSDDSSSSSTRVEGTRKRKVHRISYKSVGKRRKSTIATADKDNSPSQIKSFEENSSDIDDTYEKAEKRRIEANSSVASRRPVRRKTKPKNEDFEYDLSNLLKMEAQGYRDSQTITTTNKSSQTKKKVPQESPSNYEILNKECCGALVSLSRKAVENAKAHMKTSSFPVYTQKEKLSNIFVRPLLPKGLTRSDKISPKKEVIEENKDNSISGNLSKTQNEASSKSVLIDAKTIAANTNKEETIGKDATTSKNATTNKVAPTSTDATTSKDTTTNKVAPTSTDATTRKHATTNKDATTSKDATCKEQNDSTNGNSTKNPNDNNLNKSSGVRTKPKNINIPAVVPIKFRRQSLEVIKNPLINKNITDFTKAGMKTKILVIKPIHRNKDGKQTTNTPLKFQTIKLKETNKNSSSEDKSSDQVVVVKVPKVDRITRALSESATISKMPIEKPIPSTEKQNHLTEKTNSSAEKAPLTTEKATPSIKKVHPSTEKGPLSTEKAPSSTKKAPPTTEKADPLTEKAPSSNENAPPSSEKTTHSAEKAPPSIEKAPPLTEKASIVANKVSLSNEENIYNPDRLESVELPTSDRNGDVNSEKSVGLTNSELNKSVDIPNGELNEVDSPSVINCDINKASEMETDIITTDSNNTANEFNVDVSETLTGVDDSSETSCE